MNAEHSKWPANAIVIAVLVMALMVAVFEVAILVMVVIDRTRKCDVIPRHCGAREAAVRERIGNTVRMSRAEPLGLYYAHQPMGMVVSPLAWVVRMEAHPGPKAAEDVRAYNQTHGFVQGQAVNRSQ